VKDESLPKFILAFKFSRVRKKQNNINNNNNNNNNNNKKLITKLKKRKKEKAKQRNCNVWFTTQHTVKY